MARIQDILKKDLGFKVDASDKPSKRGDYPSFQNLENVREALMRRLITQPGSLAHRPLYGVGIRSYVNRINNISTQRELAELIKEQFERDSRVESVLGFNFEQDKNNASLIKINVKIKLVGIDELGFIFEVDENG